MGKLILLPISRREGPVRPNVVEALPDGGSSDYQLLPMAALLFALSLARVGHALYRNELFEIGPTVALGCVVGLPLLAWQLLQKT
jgi:hypothetical protein